MLVSILAPASTITQERDRTVSTVKEIYAAPTEYDPTEPIEDYDLSEAFKAEIDPLVDQLLAKCKELGMPIAVTMATYSKGESEGLMAATFVPANRTTRHLAVLAYIMQNADAQLVNAIYGACGMHQMLKSLPDDTSR